MEKAWGGWLRHPGTCVSPLSHPAKPQGHISFQSGPPGCVVRVGPWWGGGALGSTLRKANLGSSLSTRPQLKARIPQLAQGPQSPQMLSGLGNVSSTRPEGPEAVTFLPVGPLAGPGSGQDTRQGQGHLSQGSARDPNKRAGSCSGRFHRHFGRNEEDNNAIID